MIAIVPLYLIGLLGSWMASKFAVVVIFGQSPGTYDHYFNTFISGRDVVLSVIKILVFSLLVSILHCWFGINASGGPQGVGEATGRAIRASIVIVIIADMLLTLAFWGSRPRIPDPGLRKADMNIRNVLLGNGRPPTSQRPAARGVDLHGVRRLILGGLVWVSKGVLADRVDPRDVQATPVARSSRTPTSSTAASTSARSTDCVRARAALPRAASTSTSTSRTSSPADIPSNVTARVMPQSIFGTSFVDLVRPANPTGALQERHEDHAGHVEGDPRAADDPRRSRPRGRGARPGGPGSEMLGSLAGALDGKGSSSARR
jgi:hypothetical protein